MKEVQQALAGIGIPVMAGIWRTTSEKQTVPDQYIVYSTTTTETFHADDSVLEYRTYVYLNLWSEADPTRMKLKIRQAMYDYGFWMLEESDKGYNHPAYAYYADKYSGVNNPPDCGSFSSSGCFDPFCSIKTFTSEIYPSM